MTFTGRKSRARKVRAAIGGNFDDRLRSLAEQELEDCQCSHHECLMPRRVHNIRLGPGATIRRRCVCAVRYLSGCNHIKTKTSVEFLLFFGLESSSFRKCLVFNLTMYHWTCNFHDLAVDGDVQTENEWVRWVTPGQRSICRSHFSAASPVLLAATLRSALYMA